MTQIQISKIQLRRGPHGDLPGAPISGNPTRPTAGLDIAEPVFTTDTGRLYIGRDPQQNGPTVGRAVFPYENIEILTENSTDRLLTIFNGQIQDVQTFNYNAAMAICNSTNPNDWRDVVVTIGTNQVSFVISNSTNIGFAQITYFVFDTTNMPIRTGKMSILNAGNSIAPILSDEAISLRRTDLTGISAQQANLVYGSTQFRANPINTVAGPQLILQYRNITPSIENLRFRIERAIP